MKINLKTFNKINIFFMLSMIIPFVVVFSLILIDLFKRRAVFNYFFSYCLLFIFLFFPLLFISISKNNEIFMIFHHARDYIIFFVISIYLTALCQVNKDGAKIVYNSIKNLFLTLAIIKIFILCYVSLFGVSMVDVLGFITKNIGIPMMQLNSQNDFIFRLQFPIEAVLPFLIYFMIREINIKFTWFVFIQLIIILISLLLTLSRAFWAVGMFYIILGLFLETRNLTKIRIFILSFTLVPIFLWITDIYKFILDVVLTRFGNKASDLNYYSDLERKLQNNELWLHFLQSPIIGNGLGYYIPHFIRDSNDKYMYESQVLSYLMDFGIIFFFLFILKVLYIVVNNNLNCSKSLFLSLSFFSFWIILSSFNPLMLGISGAILVVFAFNAKKFNEINLSIKV